MEMKDIPGFEGRYAITPDGKVWSYRSQRYLSDCNSGTGYKGVRVWDMALGKMKTLKIHRLVAEAYIPKPDWWSPGMKLDVGHRDNDRTNNNVDNLVWQTRKQNLDTDHWRECAKKKIFSKVKCVETGEVYESIAAAARALGIGKYGINLVLLGKQKTSGGFHWERVFDKPEAEAASV